LSEVLTEASVRSEILTDSIRTKSFKPRAGCKGQRAKGKGQGAKGQGQEATRRRKAIEQMFGARKTSGP
jgi:hypothetical protein